jgi:hypothetical protein
VIEPRRAAGAAAAATAARSVRSMARWSRIALVVVFPAAIALSGCKPKAGAPCSEQGRRACADPATALVCEGGVFRAFSCKGRGGCAALVDGAACDLSGNAEGEACPEGEPGTFCSADGKRELACRGGKITGRACNGEHRCSATGDRSTACDPGEPEAGGACVVGVSPPTCSLDKKALFACIDGKWARHTTCVGKSGCKAGELGPVCDATVAEPGAACGAETRGRASCSVDHKSLMECDGARWKQTSACPEGKLCKLREASLACGVETGCLLSVVDPACD